MTFQKQHVSDEDIAAAVTELAEQVGL